MGLPRGAGIVLGIGDDCAIVRPRGAVEDWLYTTDMLIEGTHFLRETHTAADAGWKALARGLSDIAAMGGEARFCLLSLAVAGWVDGKWLDGFYGGLLTLAERAGAALVGGDLARTERVVCDIVVAGTVPRGGASPSSLARPRMPCRRGWPGCIRRSPANDPRANGSLGGLGRKSISRTQPSSSMPTG